ncbi:glycosyl hydrolase [Microbacterium sp. GXF7504]
MTERPTTTDELWTTFTTPPDDARPHAWWHWMDGNVDPDGVERDLRWLYGVGVRGAHLFEGGMGGPRFVDPPVRPGDDRWREAVARAGDVAAELGMELAVATSSGWSAAGAPWVRPDDAMQKVVWADAVVVGGDDVELALPELPAVAGPYLDHPRWGASPAPLHARDWRVLAIPDDPAHEALRPAAVTASAPVPGADALQHPSAMSSVRLPRDPEQTSEAWIEYRFDAPVTVRSMTVGIPGPQGFGAAPPPAMTLLAASADGAWSPVVALDPDPFPVRTVSFAPTTATRFRLHLSARSAAEALPPQGEGLRRPPVLRTLDAFTLTEFRLFRAGRVHEAQAKAGFGILPDFDAVPTPRTSDAGAVAPTDVHDVTALVRDGILRWPVAPAGRWRVLRLGGSPTGKTNGPALPDVTGLEVDKLDGARVRAYLDRHLETFGVAGATALLSDSIESGPQNWTDRIAERFTELRGYDPTPWLPALTGIVVGDAERTDRFLHDYRTTIAELLAAEYYGTLADCAHERGLTYYAEALEDKRPQLGDDLAIRARADVPMGAMWCFDPAEGPLPTYVADLKGASSVAHVWGKAHTGAEAFTAFTTPWSFSPRRLKHVADLQLALGVTRFCIHTSPHQPVDAPAPGVSLAPFLGQAFTVNETWAPMARPWIDYLARCAALLGVGEPDVTAAVFIGEEGPVTGLFGTRPDTTMPAGYDFDYVDLAALEEALDVAPDGTLRAGGATYRFLVLGGASGHLSVRALRRLHALACAGARIVGERPLGPRSLADDDAEHTRLCDALWGDGRSPGLVIAATADEAVRRLHLRPALAVTGGDVRWIARRIGDAQLVFLANPRPEPITVRVRPRSDGPFQRWDPVQCTRTPATRRDDGSIVIRLVPFESCFLVPGTAPDRSGTSDVAPLARTEPWHVRIPGLPTHAFADEPQHWTSLGKAARGFSGVGTYTTAFRVEEAAASVRLRFDDVAEVAEVLVNGVGCGVVWTAPFEVEIGHALRPGDNALEVRVATPWRNRLIAEAAGPSGAVPEAYTRVYQPEADPMPAGLAGPALVRQDTTED